MPKVKFKENGLTARTDRYLRRIMEEAKEEVATAESAEYIKDKEIIIRDLQMEATYLQIANRGRDNDAEIFKLMLEKAFYRGRQYHLEKEK